MYVDCATCQAECERADGRYGYTMCGRYIPPKLSNLQVIRVMDHDEKIAAHIARYFLHDPKEAQRLLAWFREPAEDSVQEVWNKC